MNQHQPTNAAFLDDPIIGIDLGTTNSLVAWCDESGSRILKLDETDSGSLPSVVRFDQGGQVVAVGQEARQHAVEYPEQTIFSIKRLMGRGLDDMASELDYLPYQVVAGANQTARVQVGKVTITPQEVSAIILKKLREKAEAVLGVRVKRAVITVPAYFDDAQRQATRDAGRIAGLQVLRMVNEPTAAALAYNLGQISNKPVSDHQTGKPSGVGELRIGTGLCASNDIDEQSSKANTKKSDINTNSHPDDSTVAVFDLGGGTFDISILRLQRTDQGMVDQVLATAGDTHLGGDDVDRLIVELIQNEIQEQFGMAMTFPPSTRQAFRNLAEAAKIKLSNQADAQIQVELGGDKIYQRTITRDEFQAMIEPWIQKALTCCKQVMAAAKCDASKIDRVIMVGGSTRIPLVRQRVGDLFNCDPYTALNPDEVVALGAGVQAAILAGVHRDMLLLDVIPLSLGIETLGGAVAKMIVANTAIPSRATEMFSTHVEGQTNVKIHVLQGERELVKDCRSLGEFDLRGIPPMPAGLPKVQVTFLVDANGILNVSATELRSGKMARIQIVPNHGLTREEVQRIESESYDHALDDMTAHRLIDLRNQARLDVRAIQRQIANVGTLLEKSYLDEINQHIDNVQAMIQEANPDPDTFFQAIDAMDKATITLAEVAIQKTLTEEGLTD